ncbi:MAG: DEAD/DEAH box helicase [Thermodesulfobacteriota bacterium]|nr:DEAD/DEAH box helicase [Thermodesulfobacteriota bacterium]
MPRDVAAIARNYLTDPVEVRVGGNRQGPKNIRHICHTIQQKNKYPELKRIIGSAPDILALVFCRTRRDTQSLAESLMRDGYQSEALHGALSQAQRDSVMRKFRRGSVRVLVATDVAARGLDVDDITHVIHYNLSDGVEIYTHRSGRTARVGKSGISIVLVNSKEISRIRMLEKRLNIRFEFNKAPAGKAVREKQYADNSNATTKTIAKTRPESKNVHELRAETKPVKGKNRLKPGKGQRFFVNMGRLDKINKGAIVRLICDKSGIGPEMIGEISLNREFSFFEVQKQAAKKVYNSLNDAKLNGRTVELHRAM